MTQISLLELLYETYYFPNDRPIRTLELFSGIGTQLMGFNKANIETAPLGISEIDREAIKAYAAIHTDYLEIRRTYFDSRIISKVEMIQELTQKNIGYDFKNEKHTITERLGIETIRDIYLADKLSMNCGDISRITGKELPKGIDFLSYSFPCTDLSKAGLRKGLVGTRSGLVYEVFRLLDELSEESNLPKVLLMENVVDLVQRNYKDDFHKMQLRVEAHGYKNYVFRMNAKDYGVAQTRDRVFMVSIRGDFNYIKPKPVKLKKRLKDYLEPIVDERYFLSKKRLSTFTDMRSSVRAFRGDRFNPREIDKADYAYTITTREGNVPISNFIYTKPKINVVGSLAIDKPMQDRVRVLGADGISACLKASDSHDPVKILVENDKKHILIPEKTKEGFTKAEDGDGVYINRPHQKRGVVQTQMVHTIKAHNSDLGVVINSKSTPNTSELRIRKFTPLECWRLMGIKDEDFDKAALVTSNYQLYKQAGNGIVVDVVYHILMSMVKEST